MKNTRGILKKITHLILKSRSVFISGHLRPDGDTVGGQLALASLLKKLGKKPFIYNADPIPKNLMFLPGIEQIRISKTCADKFDLAIILECSDVKRMGNIIDIRSQVRHTVNIDHHLSHSNFADVNYVDKNVSSSAEQIWNLFRYMKREPTRDEAMCLYTGMLTDTGCFQHSNTSALVLDIAAKLLAKGIKADWLHEQIYQHKPLGSVKFLAYVLNNFQLYFDDKIAVTALPIGKFDALNKDSEEIISYLLMIDSVQVGIFVRKIGNEIRASLRSKGEINVARVAEHFGGGGHRNAAGLSLYKSMDKSIGMILKEVKKVL